jgi:hypothetical protein
MAGKRELINTGNDNATSARNGQFDEVEDVGRSSAQDQKRDAENKSTARQGDRGDR